VPSSPFGATALASHSSRSVPYIDVMDKFVGELQEAGLSSRTMFRRCGCLVSFLKAHIVRVVRLEDASRYMKVNDS